MLLYVIICYYFMLLYIIVYLVNKGSMGVTYDVHRGYDEHPRKSRYCRPLQ